MKNVDGQWPAIRAFELALFVSDRFHVDGIHELGQRKRRGPGRVRELGMQALIGAEAGGEPIWQRPAGLHRSRHGYQQEDDTGDAQERPEPAREGLAPAREEQESGWERREVSKLSCDD
jgi:hypothetical protein